MTAPPTPAPSGVLERVAASAVTFDFIREWFVTCEARAAASGKRDSAALWRDGLQHLDQLHAETERLTAALAEARAAEVAASTRAGGLLMDLGRARKMIASLRAALAQYDDAFTDFNADSKGSRAGMRTAVIVARNVLERTAPRPETQADALRSLGLTRGTAADGTEVWE